jgi:hypothetical protein
MPLNLLAPEVTERMFKSAPPNKVTVDWAKETPETVRTARATRFLTKLQNKEVRSNLPLYIFLAMTVRPLFGSLCASLDDFLMKPMSVVEASGASAVAILDANQPVFYVVSPSAWRKLGAPDKNGLKWTKRPTSTMATWKV